MNGQHGIWAGDYLTDRGANVTRVRLISKDGQVLEDMVEQGLVLFQTNYALEGPFRLEAYADTGELLGTQIVFDYKSLENPI